MTFSKTFGSSEERRIDDVVRLEMLPRCSPPSPPVLVTVCRVLLVSLLPHFTFKLYIYLRCGHNTVLRIRR